MLTLGIPFHSNPDLLRRTLTSIERQSSQAWEVLVCDDSQGKLGQRVVEERNHPRIHWVANPEPNGIARNWNFTVSRMKTELFTLTHADDELEPTYVEEMLSLTNRHPEAYAYFCRTTVINQEGKETFSFPDWIKGFIEGSGNTVRIWKGQGAATQLLRGNFIFCPTLVYRRTHYHGDFEERFSQVMDLNRLLQILERGGQIVGSPLRLYRYRRHSGNLTALKTADHSRFDEEKKLYREWAQRFHNLGWTTASKTARDMRIIHLHQLYRRWF